jgi:periplasmic protein CpxP/Spy
VRGFWTHLSSHYN